MIYAVNKWTKEHRVAEIRPLDHTDWMAVEADSDGWIPWHGGECPLPDNTRCDTKVSYSSITIENRDPKTVDWWLVGLYRPILDTDTKPEPVEWDGEGLPPVGEVCELSPYWHRVEIVAHFHGEAVYWDYHDGVFNASHGTFRPIPSRKDMIVNQIMDDCGVAKCVALTIFNKGYRKCES